MSNHEFTLESILELKDERYIDFTIYLKHTYCIENLYFWEDVQAYRLEPTVYKCNTILQHYIITNSPYEINIPCDMREKLLGNDASPTCFDETAEMILELIRINSFLPWYHTFYSNHRYRHSTSFLSPSISFQDKWHFKSQFVNVSRPSFSSLRSPSSLSSSSTNNYRTKLAHLFQRQKNSLVFKWKNSTNSWLAKK